MSQLKKIINKLDEQATYCLEQAANICVQHNHESITIAHWLSAFINFENQDSKLLLQVCDIDLNQLKHDSNYYLTNYYSNNINSNSNITYTPVISLEIIELLKQTWSFVSIEFQRSTICNIALLFQLITDTVMSQKLGQISDLFSTIDHSQLEQALVTYFDKQNKTDSNYIANNNSNLNLNPNSRSKSKSKQNTALSSYAINLNEQAKLGKLDSVIGREHEIQMTIDILCRRRQNNTMLIGDPGVGKTAIVEGLALRIIEQNIPDNLINTVIYALDMGLLLAGASVKGEFEQRLNQLIAEIKQADYPIIIFIDEAHTLVGAGNTAGQADAANLLKPALARGEFRCIAATTWAEYKKYFEQDAALTRRFQTVKIPEPSIATAEAILRSIKPKLEQHHGVFILNESIVQAVNLSNRYINERKLPDKAISILDTACARVSGALRSSPDLLNQLNHQGDLLQNELDLLSHEYNNGLISDQEIVKSKHKQLGELKKQIEKLNKQWCHEQQISQKIIELLKNKPKDSTNKLKQLQKQLIKLQQDSALLYPYVDQDCISQVISQWTGIPVNKLSINEFAQLNQLEQQMKLHIVQQDNAISCIAAAIKTAKLGLGNSDKPLGVFLLTGPSGVGKTETAEMLAELIFGAKENMTVINLSEYKEAHKISTLVGAPPGYVGYDKGGTLTEAIRQKPYSLILLDEVEKAHSSIQDIFYQLFDKGTIIDSQGQLIDAKNTVIILTSNAASEYIIEQEAEKNYAELQTAVADELLANFKAAFLGRLTILPYLSLKSEDLTRIAELKLKKISDRYLDQFGTQLEFTNKFYQILINQCQQTVLGARQIDQYIQHKLLNQLSQYYLETVLTNADDNIENNKKNNSLNKLYKSKKTKIIIDANDNKITINKID